MSKGEELNEKDKEKVRKILPALRDGWLRYPAKVAIYPIMDTLQLLIQKPTAFAIIRHDGKEYHSIFSTVRYPEHPGPDDPNPKYQAKFKEQMGKAVGQFWSSHGLEKSEFDAGSQGGRPDEGYIFEIGLQDNKPSFVLFASLIERDAAFPPLEEQDRRTLLELMKDLLGDQELSDHIRRTLEILSVGPKQEPPTHDRQAAITSFDLLKEDQEKYVESMRNIVSTALSEVAQSPILKRSYKRKENEKQEWLNLYCSIRRAVPEAEKRNGLFPYTVQYVLSRDQQRDVGDAKIAKIFENPLGKQGRSISDPVFYSGVNEFSYALPNSDDRNREDAEQTILGMRTSDSSEARKFLIVPIHVGGIVWATLFTTPLPNADENWSHNYYLYRILLTQVAERFRVAAKQEYRIWLRQVFESEMKQFEDPNKGENRHNVGTICTRINGEWEKLTAYFPYEQIELQLVPKPNGDEKKFFFFHTSENTHACFGESLLPGFDRLEKADLDTLESDLNERFKHAQDAVDRHRFALRTASAAIMGRNMSHNIGSHVLARYSNEIGKEREPEKKTDEGTPKPGASKRGALDHRGEFLSYLQRRMDFLAEVATSDRAFWSAPVSLRRQVERLNYCAERKLYRSGEPILLSHITGKGDLSASVEWGLPDGTDENAAPTPSLSDGWVSCPGGEVGIQALFVILENIIRNSARHGPTRPESTSKDSSTSEGKAVEWVRLFLNVDEERDRDFVKIDIIDPRTKLDKDGYKAATQDKAQHKPPLHEYINCILKGKLTEKDGAPVARNWGIREMQICAYYLRRISLFALEISQVPEVLQADIHCLGSDKFCLKYTLYMERPKLMAAVVGDMAAVVGDSEEWSSRKETLLRKGVCVVPFGGNWNKIAEHVSQYGFLLVDKALSLPETRKRDRASLPIRALKLAENEISSRIDAAHKADGMEWAEMLLHGKWAEEWRNSRKKDSEWRDRQIWGVFIASEHEPAIPYEDVRFSKSPTGRDGGLFCVKPGEGRIEPLPPAADVEQWCEALRTRKDFKDWKIPGTPAMAAVWLDHVSNAEFGRGEFGTGRGGIGQAAKAPSTRDLQRLWISAEVLFSDSPHADYLRGCAEDGGWEILAAAVARVVVFDERVQFELEEKARSGLSLWDTLRCMGVWVPKTDQCCNFEEPKFDPCKEYLKKPAFEQPDQTPIDIFVIHLSVLEALKKDTDLKKGTDLSLKAILEDLIEDTQAKEAEIVIVTGRGVPDIDIDNVRYLPISALLESLVRRPSKLALMRSLWSASCPPQTFSRRGESDGN